MSSPPKVCTHWNSQLHSRLNRDYVPPLLETHIRCLDCGYQSPWHTAEEQPSR